MAAYLEDTIAAIATAAGRGAISILRLSGRDARAIGARILRSTQKDRPFDVKEEHSHRARRARLVSPEEPTEIDDVLVVPMLAPRSYTGEDTIEIHCHGGRVIADLALRAALGAGARPARAGEFTERAYLNGRLDLCQAEAVEDIVSARSEAALEAARRQLAGDLSQRVLHERDEILDARALVEAHLDFPEEDLPRGAEEDLLGRIGRSQDTLAALLATYARGRLVREGVRVVLVGRPNVGKSSLLNAMLGRERALVSPQAGTTRDYLEEPLAIGSLEVLLYDTAGMRCADDHVERAGVERSEERVEEADALILVLDGSEPLTEADGALWKQLKDRPLVTVRNKSDLRAAWCRTDFGGEHADPVLAVSAIDKSGVDELTRAIEAVLPDETAPTDGPVVTNIRHRDGLLRATGCLDHARQLIESGRELELVAVELQEACHCLDDLVGPSDNEDVLDRIFSRFCVGK